MRKVLNINTGWDFSKDNKSFEKLNLPHTWNNMDGQDGGADYYRGKCFYKKELTLLKSDKKVYIEFEGANHIANVSFNGTHLGEHKGGFSTFRYELTDLIGDKNLLEVSVDNSENIPVYPQQADFTFFGGLYRDVNIIEVDSTHFDLLKYGSDAIFIKSKISGGNATISVDAHIIGETGDAEVYFEIADADGEIIANAKAVAKDKVSVTIDLENPLLWDGATNPNLYTLKTCVVKGSEVLDNKEIPFGIRSFSVDNDKGFILNKKNYPLHGVSRHQDRIDKGWAIAKQDHEQDVNLIKDVGANTIRLAHYQHDQYFYDLCDTHGMIIWAEIPFITMFIEGSEARDNTISQMKELVYQNYNHPSICFWGISNEITIGGETAELESNQKALVDVIKSIDDTRLTTLANVSFVEKESTQNDLTDIIGYNHYFGWYGGELADNEEWIDAFHAKYPQKPLCISEYGAEGILAYHTNDPQCRDYTEEYHATYHEHMLKIFAERPFLWATYQWNMFDFAADSRDEGGVKGRNNKGLVTFDREIKKDAYFVYKAYWSAEKFVHVTGRRYFDRVGERTTIKVYSNCESVTLWVNDAEREALKGDKIFVFANVSLNMGKNTIKAVAGGCTDEIILNRCETPNESYVLIEESSESGEGVKNWFDDMGNAPKPLEFKEGYFSIKDTIGAIWENEEAKEIFAALIAKGMPGNKPNPGMMKMLQGMKVEVVLKMAGKKLPAGAAEFVNEKLQQVKK